MRDLEIQKVLHLDKELAKKKPKLDGLYMLSEKLDGIYITVDYDPEYGWQPPTSSADRIIPALAWATELFEKLPEPKERCRFIAEATIPGLDFHTANGIFNRSIGDYSCKDVVFSIHDYLQYSVIHSIDAINRYKLLSSMDTSATKGRILIHPILHTGAYHYDTWMKYFDEVTENGGEGIVAKRETGIYSAGKRNSDLLKIKLENTFDLLVTNYFTSLGEKGNIAYNLTLKNKAGITATVRVGKYEDIREFNINSPIGKVAEIVCMKQLPDGNYREARFKCLREDKQPQEID